jgi:hypothetical protein
MIVKKQRMSQSIRVETILKMAISASLGSLGIVLSTVVVFIPNFELISVTIFLVSLLFGVYYGLLTAISVPLVYEFIITTILGPASYLIVFKLISYIILALFAGLGRKIFLKLSFWELGIIGSLFALLYDVLITLGFQVAVIQTKFVFSYLIFLLVQGVIFTIVHIISNFIMFSLVKTILNWIMLSFKVRGLKQLMLPSISSNSEERLKLTSDGGGR